MDSDLLATHAPVQEAGYSSGFEPDHGDAQGIDWQRLHHRREDYRADRIAQYRNYTNVVTAEIEKHSIREFQERSFGDELSLCDTSHTLYKFYRNFPEVHSTVVHFQLRNLIWSTSCHDVFVVHNNRIVHWNLLTGDSTVVLDLTGTKSDSLSRSMGVVHISTSCVKGSLAAAGGFNGEIVLSTVAGEYKWGMRASSSDNCITNGLELTQGNSGAGLLIAANNDERVRVIDLETQQTLCTFELEWASNGACMCPTRRNLISIVGDNCDVHLHDMSSKRPVMALQGHLDWSFAVNWHPGGNLLATGNQDCTVRLWDIRNPRQSLDVLPSTMGAVRSCRFSPDGLSLAVSEPADFVHVYDLNSGCARGQDIDFFGEISGISFDPSSSLLFIGIPDRMYNSVLCYQKPSL